jgi:hypothetical protein
MEAIIQRLETIKSKIESIQSNNTELSAIIKQKNKEIERLKKLIEIQNNTIKDQEYKLKVKSIAEQALSNDNELSHSLKKRELKFKINEMLKELDKLSHLIHQS